MQSGKNKGIISCMKYQRDVTNDKACHINCQKLEGTYNEQVNMNNFFIFCLNFHQNEGFYVRNGIQAQGRCRRAEGWLERTRGVAERAIGAARPSVQG